VAPSTWPVIRTASDGRDEHGSAAVDFVLVGSLVTLLFLAVIQLGVDFHVRNVLAASVAEGARYGANADVADAGAGADRANALIAKALGARYAHATAAPEEEVDGAPVVTIHADVRLPLVAWFLPVGPSVHVTGHALLETP
jgi:Flp pilus assembly protein TadG